MRTVLLLAAAGLRGRSRAGLAATVVVLALSAVGLATGLAVQDQGAGAVDRLAARANVADVVVWAAPPAAAATGADQPAGQPAAATDLGGELAGLPGVVAVTGPLADLETTLRLPDSPEKAGALVTALADPDVPVNRPLLVAGRWLRGADEVVLERSAAAELGVAVGDRVSLARPDGTTAEFTVAGTANDLTDCGYPQCDTVRLFATAAGLDRVTTPTEVTYWLDVDTAAGVSAEAVAVEVIRRFPDAVNGANTWPDTRGDLLSTSRVFGTLLAAFGAFLLVAVPVIVSGAMTSRMAARRREIALFGAVGVRPAQITAALLVEHLVLGVGAAVLGWLAAALLAPSLEIGAAVTGRPGPSWSLADLLITTATLVALLTVATLVGAVRAGRAPVVDTLRDAPPTADRRSRLARLTARVPGPLVLLGLGRLAARPGRSALTGLTMLVAVTGAVVAGGFMVTVTGTLDRPAATGEPWQVMVSRGDVPTAAVEAELARTPGVERWWSEAERRGSRDGQTFRVRALGGEQAPGYEVGAGRLPSRPDEVALGYGLLDQLGLAVGQRATIEVAGKPRELTVVGWYRTAEDDGRILVLPLSGLLAVEPDAVVSQYRVALTPGTSVAATMAGLSAALGPGVELHEQTSDVPGRTVIELVTMLIAGVLVVVALANMLHALLAANREASRDIGVAGALGVTARQLVSQSAVAAAVLGAAAVAVGLPLGLLAFRLQSDAVARDIGLGPGLGVLPPAWFLAALAAGTIALAAASGAAAAAGLARRPLPDLLRWE